MLTRAFRTGDPVDTLWRIGVAVAAGLAVFVLNLFAAVHHEYDARMARDAARAPIEVVQEAQESEAVIAEWGARHEILRGEPIAVAMFLPRGGSSQTPPGVERWPDPGEVFASPALLSTSGSEGLLARYGSVAGEIDPDVLADPNEKVMYAGVDPDVLEAPPYWVPITGFGVEVDPARGDNGYFGSTMYQSARSGALLLLMVFGLAPLLVLLAVLTRIGGERRRATVALLVALGASRRQVRVALWRAVRVPLAVGATTSVIAASVLARVSWSVPFVGYAVSPSPDVRQSVLLATSAVLGTGMTWTALWWATRPRATDFASPRPVRVEKEATGRPVLALLATLAAVNWLYSVVSPTNPTTGAVVLFTGVLLCVLLIGPVTASLLTSIAKYLGTHSRRRRRPTEMLVARELASMARPAVRATVFMGVIALAATFATVIATQPNEILRQAEARQAINAGRSLTFEAPDDAAWLPAFGRVLPTDLYIMAVARGLGAVDGELTATCEAQIVVLGACAEDTPVSLGSLTRGDAPLLLQLWGLGPGTIVRSGEVRGGQVLVISDDGRAIDPVALTDAMRPLVSPQPMISEPDAIWVGGALVAARQARWILVVAAIASIFAATMGGASVVVELVRMRRRHRIFAVYAGPFARHLRLGLGLVGLPLFVGATVGAATALLVSYSAIVAGNASSVTVGALLLGLTCFALTVATVVSLGAGLATYRRALGYRAST